VAPGLNPCETTNNFGSAGRFHRVHPIKWTHLIGTQLKIKELEHVLLEKAGHLFRGML
jgi:hypothetical protein